MSLNTLGERFVEEGLVGVGEAILVSSQCRYIEHCTSVVKSMLNGDPAPREAWHTIFAASEG